MRIAPLIERSAAKRFALMWLIFLGVLLTSGLGISALAAQRAEYGIVDEQVWRQLQNDAGHETTFVLKMQTPPGDASGTAIDNQIALVELLETLLSLDIIQPFAPSFGEGNVLVTGPRNAVLFLSELPGVATIMPYQGDESSLTAYQELSVEATGQITGVVTGPDGVSPLEGIAVTAYFQLDPVSWPVAGIASTASDGSYTISGLETGIFRVRLKDPEGNHNQEYYNNKLTFETANAFIVIDGQITAGIDASLNLAGHITGRATDQQGEGVKDVVVSALRFDGGSWQIFASALTDNRGDYDIGGLVSDTYRIQFADIFRRFVTEYYDNVGEVDSADDVLIQPGQTVSGIDAELGPYGSLTGSVTGTSGQQGVESVEVNVYEYNNSLGFWDIVAGAATNSEGDYEVNGLTTKYYRVEFIDPLGYFAAEYFDDQPDIDSALDVSVTLGLETGDINAVLAPPSSTVLITQTTGWNLISYPIQVDDPEIAAALSSITGTYEIIWAHDVCDPPADQWKRFDPDVNPIFNSLHEIVLANGLWLQMRSPQILEITGWEQDQVTLELCEGWNLIGYPSLNERPVEQVLDSIDGKFEVIYQYVAADAGNEWKKYDPDLPFGNTLTAMRSGYGYWIEMNQDASLTITNRQTPVADPN